MEQKDSFSHIHSSAQDIWSHWKNTEWFEEKIAETFRVSNTPGKETALLIEREIIKDLEKKLPNVIGREIKNGKEVPNSMGDFWVNINGKIEPVNIKVKTTENASSHMVSSDRILKALATGSISQYWILMFYITDNDPYNAEIISFNLLENIEHCHYDAGAGNIMLKKDSLDKIKSKEFSNENNQVSKEEIIITLNSFAERGYNRFIENRASQIEHNKQIEAGHIPSLNNIEIGFKDSKKIIVNEGNKRTQKISLWEDIPHELEITDFIQQNPDLDESFFISQGKQAWLDDVERNGGLMYWKNQVLMGDCEESKKSKVYWTEERIKLALTAYMKVDPSPSLRELRSRGPKGLASAIHKGRGIDEWKKEVRKELPELEGMDLNAKEGRKEIWTEARIRLCLQQMVEEHNNIDINLVKQHEGLFSKIKRLGGIKRWRIEMGLVDEEEVQGTNSAVSSPGREYLFTDKQIEQELTQIFEDGFEISERSLRRLSKESLLYSIQKRGGIREWRNNLSLDTNIWTEEIVLDNLISLVEKHNKFGLDIIRKYGPVGLERAIRDTGGTKVWKKRLGIANEWTDDKIEKDLKEFQKQYPLLIQSDFFAAERVDLYYAMGNNGGVNFWKEKMGVDISPKWTEEKIEQQLLEFQKDFPNLTRSDFKSNNKIDLYYAMADHGSISYWKEKVGIDVFGWTEEKIEMELKEFIKICPYLTKQDFIMHNKLSLYNAMANNGTVTYWKERILEDTEGREKAIISRQENNGEQSDLTVDCKMEQELVDIDVTQDIQLELSAEELRFWTYKRVETDLIDFVKDCPLWTQEDFVKAEKIDLFRAVNKRGGIEFWKKRLRLIAEKKEKKLPERVSNSQWSKERIEKELREFMEISKYLEMKDFKEHGRMDLYNAMRKNGTVGFWKKKLDVVKPKASKKKGSSRKVFWTEERIETELREFMKICPDLKQEDFLKNNKAALFYAITDKKKGKTLGYWQERMGVKKKQFWTEEKLISELKAFTEICPNPIKPDFEEHDRMDLYFAMSNRGGVGKWKEKIGLKAIKHIWDQEELEKELRIFKQSFPELRKMDFKNEGRMELYWAMKPLGPEKWRKFLADKD